MTNATKTGIKLAESIAATMRSEGEPLGRLSTDDLSGDDGATLEAAGILPDTPEWDEAIAAAIAHYATLAD